VPLDDEVEAVLEDGLLGGARMGVREGVASDGELSEEAAGDRHVDAGALGVERPDLGAVRGGRGGRWCDEKGSRVERGRRRRGYFGRPKYTVSNAEKGLYQRGPDRRDEELPAGRVLDGTDGRRDERRVPRRLAEEPREDLGCVLRRDDLGELDHRGEAEVAVPKPGLDRRVLLDELRSRLPVLSRPGRQLELAPEELEEARVSQLDPPALAVEGRKGDEKLGEGAVLAAEEIGEARGIFTSGRHEGIVSCVLAAS
jgi:hypothetical protein